MAENTGTKTSMDDGFNDEDRKKLTGLNFTPEQIGMLGSFMKERGFARTPAAPQAGVAPSVGTPPVDGIAPKSSSVAAAEKLADPLVEALNRSNTPLNQAETLIQQRLATAPLANSRAEYDKKVRTIREETYLDMGIEDPLRPKRKGVYTAAELRRMGANEMGFDWGKTDDPLRGNRL